MLDQFRNDLSNQQDELLPEHHTRMSRKRLAYTLMGAAFALVLFLFLIGAFRQESEKETPSQTGQPQSQYVAMNDSMNDLVDRIEKLEIQVAKLQPTQSALVAIADPNTNEQSFNSQNPISDETLKQIITSQAKTTGFIQDSDEQIAFIEKLAPESTDREEIQPAPTPKPSPSAQIAKTYVVQRGDTLAKISQRFYGSTKYYKKIYDANRGVITNINQLKVGTKLAIPEKDE